jgi:hypothetical protein
MILPLRVQTSQGRRQTFTMTTDHQLFANDRLAERGPAAAVSVWLKSLGLRIVAWADHCADRWAAATVYEQLSRLSDAELARRGLSRGTLAHDMRNGWATGAKGDEPSS